MRAISGRGVPVTVRYSPSKNILYREAWWEYLPNLPVLGSDYLFFPGKQVGFAKIHVSFWTIP